MPAYNAARTIVDAVYSVLGQTIDNLEIVICNDASTDETGTLLAAIKDPRVRVILNAKNLGEGPSRDRAIAAAKGRWFTMLDADDAYKPERLSRLLAVARQHPDAIIFDNIMACHDTVRGMVPWRPVRDKRAFGAARLGVMRVSPASWISEPRTIMQALIPTQLIRSLHITHPSISLGADRSFELELLGRSHAELFYLPEALYLYRLQATSMSSAAGCSQLPAQIHELAIPLFSWDPDMQNALRHKVATLRRASTYYEFFGALTQRRLVTAWRYGIKHPWVFPEFFRRSVQRVPYHVSRLVHGGARRATTASPARAEPMKLRRKAEP